MKGWQSVDEKKWDLGITALMGILLLGGCGSQSSQSSTNKQAADKGLQTSQTAPQSSATAQSQSAKSSSSSQTQSKALWDSKRDVQLTAFIKQWEQTMGQSYDKYDGKTPLETLSGTFPADLGNESVDGQTNVLGWSPDGSGNNTYNVVAIYNYVGTEPPLPNHIAYFFAFHDGQPVVIVDQSRDGGPRATFTKNTDLKSNFEKIAANGSTSKTSKTTSSNSSQTAALDDKTAGMLVALLARSEMVKNYIDEGQLHYGTNAGEGFADDVQGYSYITTNGDPTGCVYYQRNGDDITYKLWEPAADGGVATGHRVTKTVTISRLINDYYSNQAQKSEVDGYVSKLQSE